DLGTSFAIANFQQHTPWLVPIFKGVAYAGSLWVLAVVAILAFVGLSLLGRWRAGLLVVIAFLTSVVVAQIVQPVVNRPRPDVVQVIAGRPGSAGFPNGEAAGSSATFVL